MAGSINIVQIIMNQGKGLTPFDQQHDFSHQLFGIIQIPCGKLFYQIHFDLLLLPGCRFDGCGQPVFPAHGRQLQVLPRCKSADDHFSFSIDDSVFKSTGKGVGLFGVNPRDEDDLRLKGQFFQDIDNLPGGFAPSEDDFRRALAQAAVMIYMGVLDIILHGEKLRSQAPPCACLGGACFSFRPYRIMSSHWEHCRTRQSQVLRSKAPDFVCRST